GDGSGREPIDPFVQGDGLARLRVIAHRRPIPLAFDLLVRYGPFHDQHERIELPTSCCVPVLHVVLASLLIGKDAIMEMYPWQPGDHPHHHIFDAGLRGCGYRDGIAVTTHPVGSPENVDFLDVRTAAGKRSEE